MTLGGHAHALEQGEDPAKVSLKLAASFVEAFSVWGPAANEEGDEKNVLFLLPTIPQIVTAPIVNRTGLGGPIYPESPFDASRPDNMKMWRATQGTVYADLARGLNAITGGSAIEKGWMDVSPETLKYLWSTATGGAGKFFVDSAALFRKTNVEGLEPGDLETREIPIVRKFHQASGDIKGARLRLWTAAGEAREAMELFNRAEKVEDITERRDLAQTIAYEKRELLALAKAADKYSRAVSIKRDIVQATMADETGITTQMTNSHIFQYIVMR